MIPDRIWVKRIKQYDPHLLVEWDQEKCLFAIRRKVEDGRTFHCFYVQNDDGSFRPLDQRVLDDLYLSDLWKHFGGDGEVYYQFIHERNKNHEMKQKQIRREYLEWFNKDNKKEWKEAMENAQRGII